MLVDFAGCDVVFACEGNIEIPFVVSEIKINFSSIVENKDFTVSVESLGCVQRAIEAGNPYSVGAMSPASIFMYGSILIEETCIDCQLAIRVIVFERLIFNPVVFNSRPVEEAARNQHHIQRLKTPS